MSVLPNVGREAAVRPTLRDVAEEAGFSLTQVNTAFGNRRGGNVHPETARLIFDAAERIGYYPRRQRGSWTRTAGGGEA